MGKYVYLKVNALTTNYYKLFLFDQCFSNVDILITYYVCILYTTQICTANPFCIGSKAIIAPVIDLVCFINDKIYFLSSTSIYPAAVAAYNNLKSILASIKLKHWAGSRT